MEEGSRNPEIFPFVSYILALCRHGADLYPLYVISAPLASTSEVRYCYPTARSRRVERDKLALFSTIHHISLTHFCGRVSVFHFLVI